MIYLVAWTGGYEEPQYKVLDDLDTAKELRDDWEADAEIGVDSVNLYVINPATSEIWEYSEPDL